MCHLEDVRFSKSELYTRYRPSVIRKRNILYIMSTVYKRTGTESITDELTLIATLSKFEFILKRKKMQG